MTFSLHVVAVLFLEYVHMIISVKYIVYFQYLVTNKVIIQKVIFLIIKHTIKMVSTVSKHKS
jgi:hypothetical protein